MKRIPQCIFVTPIALIGLALGPSTFAQDQAELVSASKAAKLNNIQTTDYLVPHISTVPANAGKRVGLFVREKINKQGRAGRPVVLMVGGATISAVPVFDPRFENYSWMDHLAAAGFDVFAMDFTGYGLSPRPMMDDPCNMTPAMQQLLIPTRLAQPCPPSYPFQLTSIQSDWDEIDRVVDYLRRVRNVDKVSIIGYSRGGPRAGGYTAQHPEKVSRLFLLAPNYERLSPNGPPTTPPLPGVPTAILASADFHTGWDTQVGCASQFSPPIRRVVTQTMLDFDPVGSTWGAAGMRRAPVWNKPADFITWGWNARLASQIRVPTLVIRGDLDNQVPLSTQVQPLLDDLVAAPQKVFVHVACASHLLMWETQHLSLLDASVEWFTDGTYFGRFNGTFAVDAGGNIRQEP
ncbi:MAG: alpha/beta fold hydrolase [Acidobacteria bacterium]|nr:alpha/beta fold hydrolase [Acidobacteriota bacterium]